MLSKPINLALVYIVTIFNMMILASPLLAVVSPFIELHNNSLLISESLYNKITFSFFFLAFFVSFLMLFYLLLDFLFGFSLRASLKGCKRYEKVKDYDFLTGIFDQVKDKFDERGAKLYIKESDEINAFAVSSIGRKAIVLTSGLIEHFLNNSDDSRQFLYSIRSVMAHEMSHLINKDFLPSFLIISNQKITNLTSSALFFLFRMVARIMDSIPNVNIYSSRIMWGTYSFLNFIINFFNRFIVYNIYEILRRFISRSIEYRCDRQSAKAFGGKNMAIALAMFGESGYFTLFSTHPGTKSRIKKVSKIKINDSIIRPKFFDSLANYFSILFLIIICLYFAKQSGVDLFVRDYIQNHETLNEKLSNLWQLISQFMIK